MRKSVWPFLLPILGLLASGSGMCCALPQIVRLLRTRDAEGLSTATYVLGLVAPLSWLTYGLLLGDAAQILANLAGCTSSCLLTSASAALWTAYGAGTGQLPVLVAAGAASIPAGVILWQRCPPRLVARALERGRLGAPGRLLVAPMVSLSR